MSRIAKYPKGCGVYAIEHIESGKRYIGSSQDISRRFSRHVWLLKAGKHHSPHLQAAWSKYGEAAFRFILVVACNTPEELLLAEQLEIDMHGGTDSSYNVAPFAGAPMRGRKMTEETKAKMRESHKSRPPISEETRERHRLAAIEREQKRKADGYTLSEEGRANLSVALKGRTVSDETRKKLSEANKGKASSPEHYEMLSKKYTGRKLTEEHRAAIAEGGKKRWSEAEEARAAQSNRMKGRIVSDAERQKSSERFKGKPLSEEHKAKLAAARVGRKLTEQHKANIKAAAQRRREQQQ
jgi:group I intron endonuclease